MSDTATAAPAASPPRVTPTVTQAIRVDWGSWVSQGIAHSEHAADALAEFGVHLAFGQIPMGSFIEGFVGPKIVDQYVHMGIGLAESLVQGKGIDVAPGTVYATVANLVNKYEPEFAMFLGDKLDPMIKAALAKVGVSV